MIAYDRIQAIGILWWMCRKDNAIILLVFNIIKKNNGERYLCWSNAVLDQMNFIIVDPSIYSDSLWQDYSNKKGLDECAENIIPWYYWFLI